MNTAIHKPYLSVSTFKLILACVAMTAIALLFAPSAHAAKSTYGLSCSGKDNHVLVKKDKTVTCSKSPKKVSVQGIGTPTEASRDDKPYADDVEVTTVNVDCGTGRKVTDPALGAVITKFSCDTGSPKTVKADDVIKAKKSPTISSYKPDGSGGDKLDENGEVDVCGEKDVCTDPAADPDKQCNKANGCDLIGKYVNPAINLFSYVFGLIAVISIIAGGIQYAASNGDSGKVTAAKKRIVNTIIALVAYFFLYAFLQFMIPGGLF